MLKLIDFLLKFVPSRKPAPVAAATWNDILKEMPPKAPKAPKTPKQPKAQLIPNAVYPSGRVIVWENPEVNKSDGQQNKPPGVHFELRANWPVQNEQDISLQAVKKSDEKLEDAFEDIKGIFHSKLKKRPQKEVIRVTLGPEEPDSTAKVSDIITNIDFQTLHISADSEAVQCKIVRLPNNLYPIKEVTIQQTPLTGFPMVPEVQLNDPTAQVQVRWFVRNEPSEIRVGSGKRVEMDRIVKDKLVRVTEPMTVEIDGFTLASEELIYYPSDEHFGREVLLVAGCGPDFPLYIALSPQPISRGPEELITDSQLQWCTENVIPEDGDVIRVMTYNILSQNCTGVKEKIGNNESTWFTYCAAEYLRMSYRSGVLVKQLNDFAAAGVSIFFLQEVDVKRYESYVKPFVTTINFDTVFGRKNRIQDGVATIWNTRRFEKVSHENFYISDLTRNEPGNEDLREIIGDDPHTASRYYDRKQVVSILVLRDRKTGIYLVCTNTHLHQDQYEEWVKLIQGVTLWRKAVEIQLANEQVSGEKRTTHVLLGGDLNSQPAGAFCTILRDGVIEEEDPVWRPDPELPKERVYPNARKLTMQPAIRVCDPTVPFTNYTEDTTGGDAFKGVLDYVWVSGGLEPIRHCPMPPEEKLSEFTALPSKTSPSDHLPVIVDLKEAPPEAPMSSQKLWPAHPSDNWNAVFAPGKLYVWEYDNALLKAMPIRIYADLSVEWYNQNIFVQVLRKETTKLVEALEEIRREFESKVENKSPTDVFRVRIGPDEPTPETPVEAFFMNNNFQTLYIGTEDHVLQCQIIRMPENKYPFKVVTNDQIPLVECPLVPHITTTSTQWETRWNNAARVRWYVRDEIVAIRGNEDEHKREVLRIMKEKLFRVVDAKALTVEVDGFTLVSEELIYVPHEQHLGREVLLVAGCGQEYPIYFSLCPRPITMGPEELITDSHLHWCLDKGLPLNGDVFRVMTYNVLSRESSGTADYLDSKSQIFTYCHADLLRISYRTGILLKQIKDFIDAGVSLFFLQDVESDLFHSYMTPLLRHLNYKGFYVPESGSSHGLVTIWNLNRFQARNFVFFNIAQETRDAEANEDLRQVLENDSLSREKYYARKESCSVVVLQDTMTDTYVTCINTRLHRERLDDWIKLIQGATLWRKGMATQFNHNGVNGENQPIRSLLGGDLNSGPDDAFCRLLRDGVIEKIDPVYNRTDVSPRHTTLLTRTRLTVVPATRACDPSALLTKFTQATALDPYPFEEVIDYIWINSGLRSFRRCPMPSTEKLADLGPFPSEASPSDHLPVIADIQYVPLEEDRRHERTASKI